MDESLSVTEKKAKMRKYVNMFCADRVRRGLQCKDCPASHSAMCGSTEYFKRKSLRTIIEDCKTYGVPIYEDND